MTMATRPRRPMPINQKWQVPIDPGTAITITTFEHQRVGRVTFHCPVSGRTEGTVRMEGQTCSFCNRPTT